MMQNATQKVFCVAVAHFDSVSVKNSEFDFYIIYYLAFLLNFYEYIAQNFIFLRLHPLNADGDEC